MNAEQGNKRNTTCTIKWDLSNVQYNVDIWSVQDVEVGYRYVCIQQIVHYIVSQELKTFPPVCDLLPPTFSCGVDLSYNKADKWAPAGSST